MYKCHICPLHVHSQPATRKSIIFFFNDTATTEIYTLSLHDALPISRAVRPVERATARRARGAQARARDRGADRLQLPRGRLQDRKSTRLNSSHGYISYAVFCLKKKKNIKDI